MKINRIKFLSKLTSLSLGLAKRELTEQSTCFIFRGGEILTFDDEVAFRVKSPLEDVEAAVDAKPLLALLEKLKEEEIDVEVGDEFLVKGKRRSAGITMEAEVRLDFDVDSPEKWQPLPEDFSEAVGVVSQCVSQEENQFVLTTVHLHADYMEGSDKFQLVRFPLKTPIENDTLIRGVSLRKVLSIDPKEVGQTKNWLHFRGRLGIVMSLRRFEEVFPELGKYLEVEGESLKFPKGFVDMLNKAEIFSADNDVANQVDVALRRGKIRIEGRGPSGWYSEVAKVEYDGPQLSFRVAPKLFAEVGKAKSCIVSRSRLKVQHDKFEYVCSTGSSK